MAEDALVAAQIATGRTLVDEVATRGSLAMAFWTRTGQDWGWMLYLVSPDVLHRDPREFIDLVFDCTARLHKDMPDSVEPLNHDQIVMIGPDSDVARAVAAATAGHFRRLPNTDVRLPGTRVRGIDVPEVYVYALPAPAPAA